MDGGVGTGRGDWKREGGVEKLGGGKGWKAEGGGGEEEGRGRKELERSFGGENSMK